jgi:hypothetical protein
MTAADATAVGEYTSWCPVSGVAEDLFGVKTLRNAPRAAINFIG